MGRALLLGVASSPIIEELAPIDQGEYFEVQLTGSYADMEGSSN